MVRVAACQLALDPDDAEGAWEVVASAVATAAERAAEVVVLPELTLCGSTLRDVAEASARAETVDGPIVTAFAELSRRHRLVLVAGFCETSGLSRPYNSAVVIEDGDVRAVYRKTHLWNREKELFTPGDALPPVASTRIGTIAPAICYDIAFPELLHSLAVRGAQIIASPANWPAPAEPTTRPFEVAKAMAAASIYHVVVVVADRAGVERGQHWVGGSVICDVFGSRVAGPEFGTATVLVADVDVDAALDKQLSPHNHVFGDRRTDLY